MEPAQGCGWTNLCRSRQIYQKMVARDGIEPPTPAFSGPRSTTELSGLGDAKRLIRDSQERPGESEKSPRGQLRRVQASS